jgi:hypothetical protein
MSRYKGRASTKDTERASRTTSKIPVPEVGLGKRLDAMYEWHRAKGIEAMHGRGRRVGTVVISFIGVLLIDQWLRILLASLVVAGHRPCRWNAPSMARVAAGAFSALPSETAMASRVTSI